MFCKNCGKEITEGMFCPFCGTKTEELHKNPVVKLSKKMKAMLIAALMIVGFLVCICFQKSDAEKVMAYLEKGDVNNAEILFTEIEDDDIIEQVKNMVSENLYEICNEYYAGNLTYDVAYQQIETYKKIYPESVKTAQEKLDVLHRSQVAFGDAEQLFGLEKYAEAMKLYGEVIKDDNNYEPAQEKLNECYEFVKSQIFTESENYYENGDYMTAISTLESHMSIFNENDSVTANSKILEYTDKYLSENIDYFTAVLERGEYEDCFAILDTLSMKFPNNEKVSESEKVLKDTYEAYISEQVNLYLEDRDLAVCMKILHEGQEKIPNSDTFAELEQKVQEYIPVSLYEMDPFGIGDFSIGKDDSEVDNTGTLRQNVMVGYMGKDDHAFDIYNIAGNYSTLKGVVAVTQGSIGSKSIGSIEIYGDEILLWSDTNIGAMTEPYEINVDITGVKLLKIAMCGPGNMGWSGIKVMLCEPTIQK